MKVRRETLIGWAGLIAIAVFGTGAAYFLSSGESEYSVIQGSQCSGAAELTYHIKKAPGQWEKRKQKIDGYFMTDQVVRVKGTDIICAFLSPNPVIKCDESAKKRTFIVTAEGDRSDFNQACPFVYRPEEASETWPFKD